jgi:hypothetical protein
MGFFSKTVEEIDGEDFKAEIHETGDSPKALGGLIGGDPYAGTARTSDGTSIRVTGDSVAEVRSELISAVHNSKK